MEKRRGREPLRVLTLPLVRVTPSREKEDHRRDAGKQAGSRERGRRRGSVGNAVISERAKKCGRIEARFGPGGPEKLAPAVFGGNETERERVEDEGPTVIGSAYL